MKKLPPDPRFDHVDYRHTNLAVTFARVRRRMADEAERARIAAGNVVRPIVQRKEK